MHNATPGMYLNLTPESRLSSNIGIQIAPEKGTIDTEHGERQRIGVGSHRHYRSHLDKERR